MSARNWLPVLLGILIGLPLALYYAWVADPVEYVQTAPASLRDDYREIYLGLIAHAYASTGDLQRASARLALFDWQDMPSELAALAQREAATGNSDARAQALARLASSLGAESELVGTTTAPRRTSAAAVSPTGAQDPAFTPRPTQTRAATVTSRPTGTATSAADSRASYELADRSDVCQEPGLTPQIMIEVFDENDDPIPGVELTVIWDDGQDRFFTGLKPEIGAGYADFEMQPGVRYAVQIGGSGVLVDDVTTGSCRWESGQYPGSVSLTFVRTAGGS